MGQYRVLPRLVSEIPHALGVAFLQTELNGTMMKNPINFGFARHNDSEGARLTTRHHHRRPPSRVSNIVYKHQALSRQSHTQPPQVLQDLIGPRTQDQ